MRILQILRATTQAAAIQGTCTAHKPNPDKYARHTLLIALRWMNFKRNIFIFFCVFYLWSGITRPFYNIDAAVNRRFEWVLSSKSISRHSIYLGLCGTACLVPGALQIPCSFRHLAELFFTIVVDAIKWHNPRLLQWFLSVAVVLVIKSEENLEKNCAEMVVGGCSFPDLLVSV